MYEIDLSTVMLMGIDDESTKIVTIDNEFIVNENSKKIIDNSCKYFGGSLIDRVNMTKRLISIKTKSPIIIEESRNISKYVGEYKKNKQIVKFAYFINNIC